MILWATYIFSQAGFGPQATSSIDTFSQSSDAFDWENIIGSDETKRELFGIKSTSRVWREKNDRHPKNKIPIVKHRGGYMML